MTSNSDFTEDSLDELDDAFDDEFNPLLAGALGKLLARPLLRPIMPRLKVRDGKDDMKEITANKEELLVTLRTNREIHIAEYRKAVDGWLSAAINKLTRRVGKIRDFDHAGDFNKELPHSFVNLDSDRPELHTGDYDRAIKMLELHTEDTIVMTAQDVGRYVMDEWGWTESFKNSSQTYGS